MSFNRFWCCYELSILKNEDAWCPSIGAKTNSALYGILTIASNIFIKHLVAFKLFSDNKNNNTVMLYDFFVEFLKINLFLMSEAQITNLSDKEYILHDINLRFRSLKHYEVFVELNVFEFFLYEPVNFDHSQQKELIQKSIPLIRNALKHLKLFISNSESDEFICKKGNSTPSLIQTLLH